MAGERILYLSQAQVASLGITVREIVDALEVAFRELGNGRVEMPPKPGVHTQPDAFIHAMPAFIPALHSVGVKWVSGYPDNQKRGLPYITGLLILNDEMTGVPLAVMDCTWITAMRTGAASAVAAKYLARPDSESVGILGCGVQGKSNLDALRTVFPLKRVVCYDTVPSAVDKFVDGIGGSNLQVVKAKAPREAVDGVDMVVTAGPILRKPHATIQAGWLKSGAFASLVDFDSYWAGAAMKQADKFCTDDIPQFEHYREIGYFQDVPPIYASLGELVAGKKPGRQSRGERTMACNLGLALDDMAVAPIVFKRAQERGIGTWLEL